MCNIELKFKLKINLIIYIYIYILSIQLNYISKNIQSINWPSTNNGNDNDIKENN